MSKFSIATYLMPYKSHVITVLLTYCPILLCCQNPSNFSHLSPSLDNRAINVSKTLQDSLGSIWMVCRPGILVYDGYNYVLIPNRTIFPNQKQNDVIEDIIADHKQNIWMTSKDGLLSMYDISTGKFKAINPLVNYNKVNKMMAKDKSVWLATDNGSLYQFQNASMDSITTLGELVSHEKIYDMEIGATDKIYLSTEQGNIYSYSLKSKDLSEVLGVFTGFPGNLTLAVDDSHRLWVGTETYGLFVYDEEKKAFVESSLFKSPVFNIHKEMFLNLFYDNSGYMWGGTDGGGLYKINTATGEIDLFTKQSANEFSLSSNSILNVSKDNRENIWITTNYGKLNILPYSNNSIYYHGGSENNTPLRILSIYKSTSGVLWIGTDGAGLTRITYNADGSTNEAQYFNDLALNRGFYVQSISEDNQSNIWFGTYKNGLWVHNTKKNTFKKHNIYNSSKQEATDIRTVFKDSKGRIWVGSNISTNIYSQDMVLLASFENDSNGTVGHSIVESILEDRDGTIYIGLYNRGFFEFVENESSLENSTFIDRSSNPHDEIKSVRSMVVGDRNELWLINDHGKLLRYNTRSKSYMSLSHIESMDEQNFSAVLKDDYDNLWISSTNGIKHIDVKNSVLSTYYSTDGLQDNHFLPRSAFKDKQGTLYFGGIKGFNSFDTRHLKKRVSEASLYITSIEILNQPASSLISSQITSGIFNVHSLRLEHDQSSFSFRFYAIDNILNPNFYYAYRLKGFDEDWITTQSERLATYTNIPPGTYTFEVKAGTRKGVWDISTKPIYIQIDQPIWNSAVAYVTYLLIFGGLLYAVWRWYRLRKRLFLEKINYKKESELHTLKMNFFAKMSHEIQTPITLILGPIEDMLKRAGQNGNLLLKQRLDIISYNANRLSKIGRELTLIRNKELDKLRLNVTKNDLFNDIDKICIAFKELARKRHIDFNIHCPKNLPEAWYDSEKIEHVIYNLLSNAFKFTPKEGNIQVNVVPINSKKSIKLSVIDSGPGIPKKELTNIFELFYQSKVGKKNKGTGIGLALTKDLIDLHKGAIEVDSSSLEGTIFTITVPITKSSYRKSEILHSESIEEVDTKPLAPSIVPPNTKESNRAKKTILIVEDNYYLQEFLKELLAGEYNIILAENGEEGYYYAKNNLPDLILSDVMMPKLNGIQMSEKLQKNQRTMHVPIIFLTAKNSTNSKISGLQSGAIEYIRKPFNTNELLLKVKNIISSHEHIISKYRKEVISNPEVNLDKSQDEVFLENLVSSINSRLDDAGFKMEELADSLNMGYSSLYRKCQSLTGHSLVDFVRLLRLKKAAILITKYGYNISEAAFMSGFNDPKYFSKCFKKEFKKTPASFKKEAQMGDVNFYLKKYELETGTS
ncbi:response regulator [Fulvivirga sp. M361]|uniref:ATP-binding protein n=1 Tax=Fulvivirga sp. M361 TaxID=2594266 RepID=UPI001179D547|nr:ATP-binding protein [Fulvivirga sp. M361]TRX51204.1 response regulator [Fulvivirga sp. M361]